MQESNTNIILRHNEFYKAMDLKSKKYFKKNMEKLSRKETRLLQQIKFKFQQRNPIKEETPWSGSLRAWSRDETSGKDQPLQLSLQGKLKNYSLKALSGPATWISNTPNPPIS